MKKRNGPLGLHPGDIIRSIEWESKERVETLVSPVAGLTSYMAGVTVAFPSEAK